MLEGKEDYLDQLERNISQVLDQTYDQTVERVNEKQHELQKELYLAANQKEDYERILEYIYELRDKKQELMIQNATNEEKRRRLSDIKTFLKTQYQGIVEYDESLVHRLIEKVMDEDDQIEITLKIGKIVRIDK